MVKKGERTTSVGFTDKRGVKSGWRWDFQKETDPKNLEARRRDITGDDFMNKAIREVPSNDCKEGTEKDISDAD